MSPQALRFARGRILGDTELIRIIHEVLGVSVENYEPDMYDSITLNDTQVCKRHRDHGNRGHSLCMAFSDENGYAGGNLVIHEPTGPVKRDTRRKILQYDGSVEHEVEEIIGVDGKAPRRIAIILTFQ